MPRCVITIIRWWYNLRGRIATRAFITRGNFLLYYNNIRGNMPPPARRIPSYFRASRFSSLTASYRLSATLIILRGCSGDFAFSHRRAWPRERLPTALILLIATDNLKIRNVRGRRDTHASHEISYSWSQGYRRFFLINGKFLFFRDGFVKKLFIKSIYVLQSWMHYRFYYFLSNSIQLIVIEKYNCVASCARFNDFEASFFMGIRTS